MGKIVAIANQKGGVGKTTTAVNLTSALKAAGKTVLLCDMDPQGNATSAMGIDKNKVAASTYNILIEGADAADVLVTTKHGDVLPSNKIMSGAAIELISIEEREYILKNALAKIRESYDYIIIDCPPSLEMLTINAFCASDSILIPVQCEYFALEGLSDLISTIRIIKKRMNPTLEIEGVLMTMFDSRTNLSMQVAEEVKRFFGDKVYSVMIPRNVRLSEAPSHGKPVTEYDSMSRGALAYTALAKEVITKNK